MDTSHIALSLFDNMLILYAVVLSIAYLFLAAVSVIGMRAYLRYSARFDYRSILSSPLAPGISLLAPAYNEGNTIIDNVKSLLSVMYNDLEVIIINDGSKDDTLVELIDAFLLVKVPYHISYKIKTKEVLGVYKSKNRAFIKLTVVDKRNGGKADALNAGINISSKSLVACVDVDCILERDALLKMVMPFMEESTQVIASGGVIGIANSCVINEGRMLEVKLPETQAARFQTLEYIRSFLLGRVAWSKLNGLLLISGAFGLFNKDIVINVGGYNVNTVGEDMELVVRMRSYMHRKNSKYKVVYIPEPLCWTEAPSDYGILGRQRNRWARGSFETLKLHRDLFLNPRYGLMGLVSYPFWVFFEWLAPLVEFGGVIFIIFRAAVGVVNFPVAVALLLAVYAFSVMISMVALLVEELAFNRYKKKREVFMLILTALIEPVLFHPRVVWWSILGNLDLLKGKKSWGEMTRRGFGPYKKKLSV